MKKIIAALVAALVAIGAGLEYIGPKEDLFASNTDTGKSYWEPDRVDEGGDKAYFYNLYRSVFQVTDNSSPRCETKVVVPVRSGTDAYKWIENELFWFLQEDKGADDGQTTGAVLPSTGGVVPMDGDRIKLDGAKYSLSDLGVSAGQHAYITAPCYGTVISSHFACNYGQELKFQFEYNNATYVMTIENATCWWCCRNKGGSSYLEAGSYSANTTDSLKGTQMASGALLCVGNSGTTVTFKKVS